LENFPFKKSRKTFRKNTSIVVASAVLIEFSLTRFWGRGKVSSRENNTLFSEITT
jgi:hypothetical protein